MKQALISHSFPVTAQPSRMRRLSSKRTKLSSHSRRHLYRSPVFSLKVNRLPSSLVNKKKPSRQCVDVVVRSYPEFKDLLWKYVTINFAPVSFNVLVCVDKVDYDQIVNDLRQSNSLSGRRDKITHPRRNHCLERIVCHSVEDMKANYNVLGRHWHVFIRPRPDYGDCKTAKVLAEMSKFLLKTGIGIHTNQLFEKRRRKTKPETYIHKTAAGFVGLLEAYVSTNAASVSSRKKRFSSKSKVYKWKKKIKKPSRERVEVHQICVDVASYPEFRSLLEKYVTQKAVPVSFNVSNDVDPESYLAIFKLLIDSNSNEVRRDKIERPSADDCSRPIVKCHTLEKIKMVYKAIGRYWVAEICLPPLEDCPSNYNTLYYEMCDYIEYAGIGRL